MFPHLQTTPIPPSPSFESILRREIVLRIVCAYHSAGDSLERRSIQQFVLSLKPLYKGLLNESKPKEAVRLGRGNNLAPQVGLEPTTLRLTVSFTSPPLRSLRRRLDSLLLRHCSQPLDLVRVQTESLRNPQPVVRLSLVEQGGLPELDALLGVL
jgi:hypothetical protein